MTSNGQPRGARLEDYCKPGSCYLSLEQLALYLGLDVKTVRKFEGTAPGQLAMHKFGKVLRIHIDDARTFIDHARLSRSA